MAVQTTASVTDINKITGLQNSATNIDTAVTKLAGIPSNADNTATNETSHANVLVDSDTVSPVTPSNKLLTQSDAVAGGQVNSVVAGTNVTVDNTDPTNPIVSSSSNPIYHKSGDFYNPYGVGRQDYNGVHSYQQITPFQVPNEVTVNGCYTTTLYATTGDMISVGLYELSFDANHKLNGTLIFKQDSIDVSGTSSLTIAMPTITLATNKIYGWGFASVGGTFRVHAINGSKHKPFASWLGIPDYSSVMRMKATPSMVLPTTITDFVGSYGFIQSSGFAPLLVIV